MGNRTITITREFNAPRQMVWDMWTKPENVAKWWGPKDFTSADNVIDFRVGGKNIFCMIDANGQRFYTTGEYKEITPIEKIVVTDCFSDAKGNVISASEYGMDPNIPLELLVTLTFEEIGADRTKLTIVHEGNPEGETADMTAKGWNESLDKMEKLFS